MNVDIVIVGSYMDAKTVCKTIWESTVVNGISIIVIMKKGVFYPCP